MKVLNRLTFDSLITNGEVNEGLPLYNKDIENFYKLNGSSESYYPDVLIKDKVYIVNNDISLLKSMSYIDTAENGNMIFSTNKNAFIEVDRSIASTNKFEFEIKIKVEEFTNPTYKIFSIRNKDNSNNEIEFELYLDSASRRINLYYPNENINGDKLIKTVPDLNNDTYYMSGAGDINKNIWYKIKLSKYDNVVSLYINDRLCKTIYNKKDLNPSNVFVGALPNSFIGTFKSGEKKAMSANTTEKSITGEVEYVSFRRYKTEKNVEAIIDEDYGFSASHKLMFDLIAVKDLLVIDNIIFKVNNNNAFFIKENSTLGEFLLEEDKEYFISYIYKESINQLNINVYNCTKQKELLNIDINMKKPKLLNILDINNLYDFVLYKKELSLDNIKRNINYKMSMNQTCDLYNDIYEEYDTFKLDPGPSGMRYFLPLSKDFNSIDGAINNNIEGQFLNVGCRSGLYKAQKIENLLKYEKVFNLQESEWNLKLHEDAKRVDNWTYGFNGGVQNKENGYHAKFVMEGFNNDICIKIINCNAEFGLPSRWLGVSRYLKSFYSNLKVGDKLRVVFKAKADKPCKVQMGFYRQDISTGKNDFGIHLKELIVKDSSWNSYNYETTIDSNWDLSQNANLYFYQSFTEYATLWIDDVYIISNGNKVNISLLENNMDTKIKIPFSSQTSLDYNRDFSLVYQKKIITLENGQSIDSMGGTNGLCWGIRNNKMIVGFDNNHSEINIEQNDFINKWLTIGITKNNEKIIFYIYGKGIEKKVEISTQGLQPSMLFNSILNYDLMLGGVNDINYGCCLYKNLSILKNSCLSGNTIVDYYRTKMSLKENKLLTNVETIESTI